MAKVVPVDLCSGLCQSPFEPLRRGQLGSKVANGLLRLGVSLLCAVMPFGRSGDTAPVYVPQDALTPEEIATAPAENFAAVNRVKIPRIQRPERRLKELIIIASFP